MPCRSLVLLLVASIAHAEPGPSPRVARFDRHGYLLPAGVVARFGVPPALNGLTADLAWTPDGSQFVTADWTTITRFDSATGRAVETTVIDGVFRNSFTPLSRDGRLLFRLSGAKCYLSDTATGLPVRAFDLPAGLQRPSREGWSNQSLNLSADHRFLAGVFTERSVMGVGWRYDLGTGRLLRLAPDRADVRSVRLAPDGNRLFAVAGSDPVQLSAYDLRTDRGLWTTDVDRTGNLRAVSSDGRRLVLADGARLRVYDTNIGKEVADLAYTENRFDGLRAIDLSPDGRFLAVADGASVTVWDVDGRKVRHTLPHAARLVAFSPDGRALVSANAWVQRWDVATGKPAYPEPAAAGLTEPTPRLYWSADGRWLLTCSPDPALGGMSRADLTLWDVGAMAVVWQMRRPRLPLAVTLDRAGGVVRLCTWNCRLMTWAVGPPTAATEVELFEPENTLVEGQRAEFLRDGRLVVLRPVRQEVVAEILDPTGRPYRRITLPPAPRRTAEDFVRGAVDRFAGVPVPFGPPDGLIYPGGRRASALTGRALPPAEYAGDSPTGMPYG
ncbi:MAG TPA: hypothetical protein VM597_12680, partial [Gemmataceae bacterium]|nr:hypothetical protein [Gemmataceae bacterium]